MPIYELEYNGDIYEIEAPENASDQALINALKKSLAGNVESQKGRTFAQGLTFGFADEAEAAIRSTFSGEDYTEVRDNIRKQLADYARQNGGEALALEVAGSAIPSLVGMFIPALGQSATAANVSRLASLANKLKQAPTLKTMAGVGAAEGGVAGLGYSEADTVGGTLQDVATGTALGGTLAPVAGMAVSKGISSIGDLVSEASKKIGKQGATAVEQELRRIAKATGKTEEELISDVMDGRLVSDNRTLAATIRALSSKSDDAKSVLSESYERRGKQTQKAFQEARDMELYGSTGAPNIQGLDELDDQQDFIGQLYRQASKDPEIATPEVNDVLNRIKQFNPGLIKAVTQDSVVTTPAVRANPLLGIKGSPELTERVFKPTIDQAEAVLRQLKKDADSVFRGNTNPITTYGITGEQLKDVIKDLESQIDFSSPTMRQARATAAKRFSERDALKLGRTMATKPADAQEELMREFVTARKEVTPEQNLMMRRGAAQTFRGKDDRSSRFAQARSFADPESREVNLLDMLGADSTDISKKAQLMDDVNIMRGIVDPSKGSVTQFAQEASNKFGVNVNPAEILSALNGDVAGWLSLGTKVVKGLFKSGLSEQEYADLARLLVNEDPSIIRKALLGSEANEEIANQIKQIIDKSGIIGANVTRTATAQQGAQ